MLASAAACTAGSVKNTVRTAGWRYAPVGQRIAIALLT
jgi:hypothetical protein